MIPQSKTILFKFIYKAILFITLIVPKSDFAQTPSHFILGEEELSGIDIYDIYQDDDHIYWLATDNGLITYDGYKFTNIKCDDALSNSVFNLKTDYNNVLYGMNLSGQIFQIKDTVCEVYYKVPDSLMYKEMLYDFDENNDLVIATKSLFKVAKDKSITELLKSAFSDMTVLEDSTIRLFNPQGNSFIHLKNDLITKIPTNNTYKFKYIQFFNFKGNSFAFEQVDNRLTVIKDNKFIINDNYKIEKVDKKEILRFYPDESNLVIAKHSGGIQIYRGNTSVPSKVLFSNYLISTVCRDKEGNYLLGTFGGGILVVPNLNLVDVKITDSDINFTRITSTNDGLILLGTQNGSVYNVDADLNTKMIWNQNTKNVEILEYFPKENSILIDGKNATLLDLNTNQEKEYSIGAVKDITRYKFNTYLVGCNSGVYRLNLIDSSEKFIAISFFKDRTNCIAYDTITNTIFAGTALGLKIGNSEGASFYTINDKPIICRDILNHQGKMFITTKNKGVLIFENNILVEKWNQSTALPSDNLMQIAEFDNRMYITSDKGLIVTTLDGEVMTLLNKSDGVSTNKIIDFEIVNRVLWMLHQKGIQKIGIDQIQSFDVIPKIAIPKIWVNNSQINADKEATFKHSQNKFEFQISARNLKYQDEIYYAYQLEGIDKEWQRNSYKNNNIQYKTLPPGSYTFRVKSVCRDIESEQISYSFTISLPFWKTWWFYISVTLLIFAVVLLLFRREMNKQKKKLQLKNELNASKLIAIQSQMNPHFIFNAINSIQDLILKGDIDNSYRYIIKFSKLVRQTLNFSDKEFIPIEDELDLLGIYLELEKLRFKDDFQYDINCELTDVKVPPMLVQPFVENAIKHGLLHREGAKKLSITFTKEHFLQCTVIDNGIGRKKAQEIKDRQRKGYQSFSVSATQSRFEIMKTHYDQDLGVEFVDLEDGLEAIGTKVIIKIPYKQCY